MICEGQHARAPTGFAQPQGLPRDLAMAEMESIEESDRQHQRPFAAAFDLVVQLHTKTCGVREACRVASPTPTSIRGLVVGDTFRFVTPRGDTRS